MKRTTLKDIAAIAKVSQVAVSFALRGDSGVSESTRIRIKEIAKKLGYEPDPALSALTVYRKGVKAAKYPTTLAWVYFDQRSKRVPSSYYGGAEMRCRELGYKLEEFRLFDVDMDMHRLSKVLYSRNIRGVLFAPQVRDVAHISNGTFAWDQFSVIAFGFSLVGPKLDIVTDAQYRAARIAVRKLRSLGYRRIGYCASRGFDERTDGNLLAGYLYEQHSFPAGEQIPSLECKYMGPESHGEIREWYQRYKPDAIFSPINILPDDLNCGIAIHGFPPGTKGKFAGVDHDSSLIGRVAVDELVALIQANRRGIPACPRRILIEGKWQDGASAPRVTL